MLSAVYDVVVCLSVSLCAQRETDRHVCVYLSHSCMSYVTDDLG